MISTHILNTMLGAPAAQVTVKLEKQAAGQWKEIALDSTNDDGRVVFACKPEAGVYRLIFMAEEYFEKLGVESFFQNVQIDFKISQLNRKYHIPLLLTPYSYSTYRGS